MTNLEAARQFLARDPNADSGLTELPVGLSPEDMREKLDIKWVAFYASDGDANVELGISVLGTVFGLYKAEVYIPSVGMQRKPHKREFGESLRPVGE